jgi:spermidine/putrescine-binding protein
MAFAAGAGAGAFTMKSIGPFVRNAEAATLEIRRLEWEVYNIKDHVAAFEKKFKCKVSAGFFDGNSEAYNKLKAGGTRDFDIVMADGFWPRLYGSQGLVLPLDYKKIPNLKNVFPDFMPPNYNLLKKEGSEEMIAAPYCWGGYGITENIDKIGAEDQDTLEVLFNPKYKGKLSVSARFEENIAMAGILVADRMGTKDKPRPDGKPFNPYVLTDEELKEVKKILIEQKPLLVTRYNDTDTLERLFRANAVWAAPEWAQTYRKLHFDYLDGKSKLRFKHLLRPKEGGLGWVDTHMITSGVKDSEKLELCYEWINFRLDLQNMVDINIIKGVPSTVDTRKLIPERYAEALFMNQTSMVKELYPFDAPSDPEKWERVWSEVEAG